METTVTLDWDPPQGRPESSVDAYNMSVSPAPPYQPANSQVTRPWNITLEDNIIYTVHLVARNCYGISQPSDAFTISKLGASILCSFWVWFCCLHYFFLFADFCLHAFFHITIVILPAHVSECLLYLVND